ncbi:MULTISPECIES: extracellular solute-binding protein [Deefgea]|uniref:Extracellular solute-binding protein n=1 Tax=Deefgea chitinilytica TaxID=570276 RepID=A0ABS2C9Y8_9NEIS|nr:MULTISPECIES: extracellular solute-binding protein [Deefgea]MBM5570867.1 extracellular solute-binding protein [Deefgea chitinilytica]MBM9888096.1 extracellular solute-binding protein [Deefgea sp. CFH1-16]
MKRFGLTVIALSMMAGLAQAETVTVYSARNEQLIKPLFDAYTKETGVEVKVLTDKEGPLMARLQAESSNTPADLLITVDAGNLWQAANLGLLKTVKSETLNKNVPAHLRDDKGQWYGLSVRARTMFFNPDLVKAEDLSTYEDLADPKWKGKLCLRTSKKVYNQSLVAMMIAQHGEAKTEKIVRGWVANLATDVFADDTKLLQAIAAGQCAVGIANTYYFGRLIDKDPKFNARIFWANQKTDGVHVNVSGAGVTRYAKNEAGAVKLMEWLSSSKAQNIYADKDMEFPVNPAVKPDQLVASWGPFKSNVINMSKAGELQSQAVKLMDRAGYK